MKIKLSYFLGKKRLTLEGFCKKSGITSHEELCGCLADLGVCTPEKSDTKKIFTQGKPKAKKVTPQKALPKKKSSKSTSYMSKKTTAKTSEADEEKLEK
jgi:hypothetical protein